MRHVRGRAQFRALTRARRHRVGPLTMRIVPGESLAPDATPPELSASVAYAIGRSIGGAVVRNRLRRRLRALVLAHPELLVPGAIYLFGAEVAAVTSSPADLEHALVTLLRRGADSVRAGSERP